MAIRSNLDNPIPARATVMAGRVKTLKDPFNESGVLASMSPRFNDPVGGVFKSKIIDRKARKILQRQLVFHPARVEIVPCVVPSRVDGKKCRRFGRD